MECKGIGIFSMNILSITQMYKYFMLGVKQFYLLHEYFDNTNIFL